MNDRIMSALDDFLNFFRAFDEEGYDKNGFNRQGFNREGTHRNGTPYDRSGFDVQGYDAFGFSRCGYDREGYDRDGYDQNGYDRRGYDCDGYDQSGYDADGFDRGGYGRDGFNRDGYDCGGFDRKGFDSAGFDRDGYDADGFNRSGYGRDGFNRAGFDSKGYGRDGYDRDGYDYDGYDRRGYDIEGFDHRGFDIHGYDRGGFDSYGFSLKGIRKRDGVIWWQTAAKQIPPRLYEEITEPAQDVSSYSLVTLNPIGLLGFSNRPQTKAMQKRAKEIERLSQIGIDAEFENANPYCQVRYDSMSVKEAAEILGNPKKAREADFFWIGFDEKNSLEKRTADRLANKQLHAACYEMRKTRGNRCRLSFLVSLLALEQEESRAAAEAVTERWVVLSTNASLFERFGLDIDCVAEKIVTLLSDIAERKTDWDIASVFCKATGKYTNRYYDACIAPVIKTVQDASKKVDEAVKAVEDATAHQSTRPKCISKLKSAIGRGELCVKDAQSNARIPERFGPLSEAVNEFAQSIRNAAVAVITACDDVDESAVSLSRSLLKAAENYANSVALQHRIRNDQADLDQLADDMRYVKERDKCLEIAIAALQREEFSAALSQFERVRSMARSLQEINQIDQLIIVARKGVLAKDFERQMSNGKFHEALNTINKAISLEDDWDERMKLCQTRDQIALKVELIERAFQGRSRW